MIKVCETYEEARAAYQDGELQAWDGQRWMDIPPGQGVFFGREVHEYRRKPRCPEDAPMYFTWSPKSARGQRVRSFEKAADVAIYLWGRDLKDTAVFKRTDLTGYDIQKIEEQLEKIH